MIPAVSMRTPLVLLQERGIVALGVYETLGTAEKTAVIPALMRVMSVPIKIKMRKTCVFIVRI